MPIPPSPPAPHRWPGDSTVSLDTAAALALGQVIQTTGQPGFFHSLLAFLDRVCAMHSGGAMIFSRHQRPQLLMYRRRPSAQGVMAPDYFSGPYILDPNYQRFLAGCGSGVYWLRDVAPDDFYTSEFYRLFYSQLGLADYVDILWRIDADTALSVFLERDTTGDGFAPADIAAVNAVLPILFAAIEKHHGQMGLLASRTDNDESLTHQKVQSSIDNFGASLLTKREREVLFYMLSGYSSALTAARMQSTEGTVKIHRKSIHRKLEIGSQAELFALFIRCIPFAVPGVSTDPLQSYQSVKATSVVASEPAPEPATGPSPGPLSRA
ncbi:helix-turn-helix transcriptional regulator [Mitsuaria sp. 7]|uniref:helix-turn-helix transcriptional regulator n=1 Tax=Mitsuaria sp. 7 TaxID=1658665 RepID=UPI0012FBB2D7|nr:LuxR C-terminal-related transcriptional regulator [Mitsuaria sp. 7]